MHTHIYTYSDFSSGNNTTEEENNTTSDDEVSIEKNTENNNLNNNSNNNNNNNNNNKNNNRYVHPSLKTNIALLYIAMSILGMEIYIIMHACIYAYVFMCCQVENVLTKNKSYTKQ